MASLASSGCRDGSGAAASLLHAGSELAWRESSASRSSDLHPQTARTLLHVDRALELVRDLRNALHHAADQFGPLDRVVRRLLASEQVDLETG